jgi:hypothetical protein
VDAGHGLDAPLLVLGRVVLDDGDLGLPHGDLHGDLLRAGGKVRRLDDEGALVGVGAVGGRLPLIRP